MSKTSLKTDRRAFFGNITNRDCFCLHIKSQNVRVSFVKQKRTRQVKNQQEVNYPQEIERLEEMDWSEICEEFSSRDEYLDYLSFCKKELYEQRLSKMELLGMTNYDFM